ncbi:MAG: hypothetical protein AMJ81_00025 [Phycisphaerae bacterium SM23_33]|nr:MAG: hypothetical protein AMS14_00815 [Planctomycetes bacterium DG_20]KPK86849.1 MAG: hypothetical protein AMJ81_00025 [Phycisphaerae bacterium SM23_33]
MALYRVLKSLTTGHQPGDIVSGDRFESRVLAALVKVRAISEVRPPPLSELPGWEARAEKLREIGVVTVRDFLEADDDKVRELFNYKRTSTVAKWKTEAEKWVRAGPGKSRK